MSLKEKIEGKLNRSQFLRYMLHHKKEYIYVLIAVIFWSTTAAVAKLLVNNLDYWQVLFFTSLFGTIGLFFIVLWKKKLRIIRGYTSKDYFDFAYMGFIGIFLYYILFYKGLAFASAQEVSVINYLWPTFVALFAVPILKEKLNLKKLFALLCSFAGVYVIATQGQVFSFVFTNLKGDLLTVGAAIAFALFSVLGKKQRYDKLVSVFFYFLFCSIFSFISLLIFSSIPTLNFWLLAGIIWIGFFTFSISHVLWFLALKHGDTAKVSNMIYITPFISLIWIYLLVGESIHYSSIIGLILIITGIFIQSKH